MCCSLVYWVCSFLNCDCRRTRQLNVTCCSSYCSMDSNTVPVPVTLSEWLCPSPHSGVAMATSHTTPTMGTPKSGQDAANPARLQHSRKRLANHSSHSPLHRKTCRSRSAERGQLRRGLGLLTSPGNAGPLLDPSSGMTPASRLALLFPAAVDPDCFLLPVDLMPHHPAFGQPLCCPDILLVLLYL